MHTTRDITSDPNRPRTTSTGGRPATATSATPNVSGAKWRRKLLATAALLWALWAGVSATACLATEWRYAMDDNPRQIAPNAWSFSINLGVRPAGQLRFASAEYDFA